MLGLTLLAIMYGVEADGWQILVATRGKLVENYEQIPQLSCGGRYDLDEPLRVSLMIPVFVDEPLLGTDSQQL